MIPVTKTFFPPLNEYNQYLKRVWDNRWLTNRGDLVRELEEKLKASLQVSNITLTANGTLPIQIALKEIASKGEVITTPFSYVATTTSIVWENAVPVFVDIDPEYLTIDENRIEEVITSRTTGILATHVFGNPCAVEKIEEIAKKYALSVIYDAAHCFGVKYNGKSLFNYGDISTCSFHATKLFHTAEGGAMICNDPDLHQQLFQRHNFGHIGPNDFKIVGINAKMSELQAAMGLSVLPYLSDIIERRQVIVDYYNSNIDEVGCKKMKLRLGTEWNYSYFPVVFGSEEKLQNILEIFNSHDIFPRRYFFPSLNRLSYLEASSNFMPISESISRRILCLPLYNDLSMTDVEKIVSILNQYGRE